MQEYVKCIICEADRNETLFRHPPPCGNVVRCKQCGLIYVNPRNTEFLIYDNQKKNRAGAPDALTKYLKQASWKEKNFKEFLSQLESHLPNSNKGKLLDIGAYCGLFLKIAEQRGWETWGVEPEMVGYSYAKNQLGLNIFPSTLSEAKFPENFFDVATALLLFEHLPNPRGELKLINKLLKQDGFLVMETVNIDCIWFHLLGKRWRHFSSPAHVYFFSSTTLTQLLNQSGFKVIDVTFPSRILSLEQFVSHITMFGDKFQQAVKLLVNKSGLSQKTLRIGLHDIMRIYAKRSRETK